MAKVKTERVPIMFDKTLVDRVDEYGFDNRIRTRAEAIRHLVRSALNNDEKQKGEATA